MESDLTKLIKRLGYHQVLINRGLVIMNYKGEINLTDKGNSLIEDDSNWINKWIELWPTNLSKIIGYSVSGNTMACKTRMNKFIRDFPQYSIEDIFNATKKYLKEQELKGWIYTKKNSKFIYDKDGSFLETYCNSVINNEKGGFYEEVMNFL
jgi:hypothetical protein